MKWSGQFVFGDCWAAYRGAAGDNHAHAHAALQLSLADTGNVLVSNKAGQIIEAPSIIVHPGCLHRLHSVSGVTLILIQPGTPLSQIILKHEDSGDVVALSETTRSLLKLQGPLEHILDNLLQLNVDAAHGLDPRLHETMEFLKTDLKCHNIAMAAKAVGLSEPRLRSIAAEQLGVPLSKWVLWQKLNQSSKVLALGASLAEAAYSGGFSDQAHFTRAMRQMIGLTPSTAKHVLN